MAEYDLLIKNGTIIDGLQVPRYRGDIAIRDGRIVAMGNIRDTATRVLDATGLIVAPGFMDIHTHYDAGAQRRHGLGTRMPRSPAGTVSPRWRSATVALVLRRCGRKTVTGRCAGWSAPSPFRCPVCRPVCAGTGRPSPSIWTAWTVADWVSTPPHSSRILRLRAWVLGNDAARDPDYQTSPDQIAELKHLLREGLQAGGFGFSASFSMANRDYDGGYLPTHVAPREEFLEMASVMREFNRGSIEWTMGHALQGLGMDFLLELGQDERPTVNWNAIIHDPSSPDTWREQLAWTERANKEAPVLAGQYLYAD